MSDSREWFAPKRYGFGATPVTWQGWALTIGFVLLTIILAAAFGRRPLQLFGLLAPFLAIFILIAAKTTRGGWHWRWGGDD
jgi:hypothetical protein